MTSNTQIIHSTRYRLSQAVTKLAEIYPDVKELRKALHQMVEYELRAIEAERSAERGAATGEG